MSQPLPVATVGSWYRKPLRSAVQLVAGLGATWVMGQLGPHIPVKDYAAVFGVVTFVIGSAQNIAEQNGWVPILLPSPAQKAATAAK